ncbi:MAG: ComF family protein [Phycisphaerales bacterium]|nr:ComF family protein [Phycisphaerales bacterium]
MTQREREVRQQRFQWPPAPLVEQALVRSADESATVTIAPPRGAREYVRDLWAHFERLVLAPTVMPAGQAMAQYEADAPGLYCERCGGTIGPFEQREFGCGACHDQRLRCERMVRLGAYEGELAQWVGVLKFQRVRPYGVELGRRLGAALREAGVLEGLPPGGLVVQAVPMSRRRRMGRGIEHAQVIAKAVGAALGAPVARGLWRAHRPSQLDVPAGQREANVRGTIGLRRNACFSGQRVVLVDDVRTTGATIEAAARGVLDMKRGARVAGPRGADSVWGAVVSVTPRD